jgi:hypothetical protein
MSFERRGIVFTPKDLEGLDWAPLLAKSGRNVVAQHGGVEAGIAYSESAEGQRFALDFYAGLGFHSATSFGVFLDAEYFAAYGIPPVGAYGRALQGA